MLQYEKERSKVPKHHFLTYKGTCKRAKLTCIKSPARERKGHLKKWRIKSETHKYSKIYKNTPYPSCIYRCPYDSGKTTPKCSKGGALGKFF